MPAPSSARYGVVAVTAFAAFWMYIDRVSFSTLATPIATDLGVESFRMDYVLGAFFFSYALFQIPTGALADRFGPRAVLAACVVAWSVATALTSFASGFTGLLVARLLLGVTEAGAYPAATRLVRSWAAPGERGRFSSFVTIGGRLGLAAAPFLTGMLAIAFVGLNESDAPRPGVEGNWRAVFIAYGAAGVAVAGLLWFVVRDGPDSSAPKSNAGGRLDWREQLAVLSGSRNLWFSGGLQFGTNVGWALMVTLLPGYFAEVHKVPLEERARMQSYTLVAGCVGMIGGGFLTDALAARFGVRWGRCLAPGVGMLVAAGAAATCPFLDGPWAIVAALAVISFTIDMGNPSIWSFNQDVGGRRTGAAAGWGNMWGNLGAALSPILLGGVSRLFGWPVAFLTCAGFFVFAATCGFLMNAARPLEDKPSDTSM